MTRMARRSALYVLLTAIAAGASAVEGAATANEEARSFADSLVDEINRGREALGLAPLAADPALAEVAQRRADSMVDDHWFGFVSPNGEDVEAALDAAEYPYRLVTEKLVHSPLSARELGADWRRQPEGSRRSLFHAEITRIGVGVRADDASRLIDIVLAATTSDGPAAASAPAVAFDGEHERQAVAERLDERRREERHGSLWPDPALADAAQRHAEALLAALARGQGTESVEPFGDRLADVERAWGRSGRAAGGNKTWQQDTGSRSRSTRYGTGALAVGIVVDAASAAEALDTLLASPEAPDLLDPGLRRLGVGVARGETGDGVRTAWVIAAARR